MAELSFQNRLQLFGQNLTKSEHQIAQYIMDRPSKAVLITSMELAEAANTSNSTVTRFCQKLQYRNFVEFQMLLAAQESPSPVPPEIVRKMQFYYHETLSAAVELIHTDALHQFVSQIRDAGQVLIFGIGSSGLTAQEFGIRLMQMGVAAAAITDSHLMLSQASQFSEKDLIIAVSNSGETREIVRACEIARGVGTPICALTQNDQTPLTQLASTVLFAGDIGCVGDARFVNSQMPLLFLIDTITYVMLEDSKRWANRQKALQALANR